MADAASRTPAAGAPPRMGRPPPGAGALPCGCPNQEYNKEGKVVKVNASRYLLPFSPVAAFNNSLPPPPASKPFGFRLSKETLLASWPTEKHEEVKATPRACRNCYKRKKATVPLGDGREYVCVGSYCRECAEKERKWKHSESIKTGEVDLYKGMCKDHFLAGAGVSESERGVEGTMLYAVREALAMGVAARPKLG